MHDQFKKELTDLINMHGLDKHCKTTGYILADYMTEYALSHQKAVASEGMKVNTSGDHRVYMSEYEIPTIQLGCGGVIVSDLIFKDEQLSGIGFSLGQGEVGENHTYPNDTMATDIGVFFQIIATKPESLQVVIDKLEKAKHDLLTPNP